MANVYFTRDLSKSSLINLYTMLDLQFDSNDSIAIKVHTGEAGNQNFLGPNFWSPIILYLNGTIVETNSAYEGARNTTESHRQLLDAHGWSIYPTEILDGDVPDIELEIPDGRIIKRNYIGGNTKNYNSAIVLSHFKGHRMGGFGGAIKQLSIGFASANGKRNIHGYGNFEVGQNNINNAESANQEAFLGAMVDAASSVINFFNGHIIYMNALVNISKDCDCDANASPPAMNDIGILASTDPVAIDMASLNIIANSDDPGKEEILNRVIEKNGTFTLQSADGRFGSRSYRLMEI